MTPILKWPGGKRRMARLIDDAFGREPIQGYCEPFAGGLAVFCHLVQTGRLTGLHRAPRLSDACGSLMVTYAALQAHPARVREQLTRITRHHTTDRAWTRDYYTLRKRFNAYRTMVLKPVAAGQSRVIPITDASCKHAAEMLWVNKACFNGLWRTNRSGQFNASAGSYQRVKMDLSAITAFAGALHAHQAELMWSDWRRPLSLARQGDCAFIDSPYLPLDDARSNFTSYSALRPWGVDEHRELAYACAQAASRGVRVVLTNHDCTATHETYPESVGWRVFARPTLTRSISQSSARMRATEVVLTLDPNDVRVPEAPNTQLSLVGDAPKTLEQLYGN